MPALRRAPGARSLSAVFDRHLAGYRSWQRRRSRGAVKWQRGSASECGGTGLAKRAAARHATAKFTVLQGQYLAFIRAYSVIHGVAPAEADMQRFFRVSAPSVHQMVLTLEARGLVARTPGHARSLRVLVSVDELPALAEPAWRTAG